VENLIRSLSPPVESTQMSCWTQSVHRQLKQLDPHLEDEIIQVHGDPATADRSLCAVLTVVMREYGQAIEKATMLCSPGPCLLVLL
jgi:hypothetical protein